MKNFVSRKNVVCFVCGLLLMAFNGGCIDCPPILQRSAEPKPATDAPPKN